MSLIPTTTLSSYFNISNVTVIQPVDNRFFICQIVFKAKLIDEYTFSSYRLYT